DSTFLMRSHGMRGCTLLRRGEPAAAKDHLERSLALYDPHTHRPQIFRFGYDPKMAYLSWMAWSLWLLGYPDQALARAHEALSWAQELAPPHTLAWALGFLTLVQMCRRDWQATQERTEEAMTLSTEQGFPLWLANATFKRGTVLAEQGQGTEGIEQMRQSITA